MTNINTFTDLLEAVKKIGISVSEQTRKFLAALDEGVEIEGEKELLVTEAGLFDIAPNGDLYRVAIFINQTNKNSARWSTKDWHKFHLYRCRTIDNYPVGHQWRYKKTNNRQGLFQYIIIHNNKEYRKDQRIVGRRLNLCMNCHDKLPAVWRSRGVGEFPLDQFYKHTTGTDFGNTYEYDCDQIPKIYSHDWPKIARSFKEKKHWTCEACHRNLANDKHYLHAHHVDGNVTNNAIANLTALCIACHAEQPLHDHIKSLDEYQEFIALFGSRQQ